MCNKRVYNIPVVSKDHIITCEEFKMDPLNSHTINLCTINNNL